MLWRMLRKALFFWMLYLLDRSFDLSSASRARHQNPSAFTKVISYRFAESMTFWNNASIHTNQQAKDIYFDISCIRANAGSKRITQALAVKNGLYQATWHVPRCLTAGVGLKISHSMTAALLDRIVFPESGIRCASAYHSRRPDVIQWK